jgi:hypothetical protein
MLYELENRLWELLQLHPAGLSEYEILRILQCDQSNEFGPDLFRDDLQMYRAHFLLFHALYRLSDYLLDQQVGRLDIHALKILLRPYSNASDAALAHPDPLRKHYLNLDNLRDTTLEDVQNLLGQFWTRYFANEKQNQALQVMGLDLPVTLSEIEKRYRKLAMHYHPDRGGDKQQFIALQQAVVVLRQCGFRD